MTMTINPDLRGAELAQAVAEYITAHPEEWDQDNWGTRDTECGTQMCIAGTAALMTGCADFDYAGYLSLLSGTNYSEDWTHTGRELLGLTPEQARDLFVNFMGYGESGLREMWHRVASLYPEGAITIPAEYR